MAIVIRDLGMDLGMQGVSHILKTADPARLKHYEIEAERTTIKGSTTIKGRETGENEKR